MTRSRARALPSQESPATKLLRSLLRRFDQLASPIYTFDEVSRWPDGTLKLLSDLKVLRAAASSTTVVCDGCPDGHTLEVDVRDYPTGPIGVANCYECGLVKVPTDRLKQWQPDFNGVAGLLAASAGAIGGVAIEVPGRLAFLGILHGERRSGDLFLGRGMTWPDAAQVLDVSPRIRASSSPHMLVPALMPTPKCRLPLRPAFGAVSELAYLANKRLVINLDPIWLRDAVPHGDATSPKWLTVSEAATLLTEDVDGLSFKNAKARVSSGATRNHFKSNGKTGTARRIDRDSFSTWRIVQREKNLDDEN
ncbi:MAG: hypothetical protein ACIAXF_17800 [Phycisphaerales bacterium JB063]